MADVWAACLYHIVCCWYNTRGYLICQIFSFVFETPISSLSAMSFQMINPILNLLLVSLLLLVSRMKHTNQVWKLFHSTELPVSGSSNTFWIQLQISFSGFSFTQAFSSNCLLHSCVESIKTLLASKVKYTVKARKLLCHTILKYRFRDPLIYLTHFENSY